MIESFRNALVLANMSANTITAYLYAVRDFSTRYGALDKSNLLQYKLYLIERYKPSTVNLRILALNRYLEHVGQGALRLKAVRVQQRSFLENVISQADYLFLKQQLSQEPNRMWYFVVRFLSATGARVSELIQLKAEHVRIGYLDLYSKGGKVRRLFIPEALRREALAWLSEDERHTGYLFVNRGGQRITPRGIAAQLKRLAVRYGLNPAVVYPHSFRHRYAKNFLEACNDLSLLADLMGHESIETTRIYLRRTAMEQRDLVDRVVTW